MTADGWVEPDARGLLAKVRVTPNAKRSEVLGVYDGRLRVKLAAPALDGRANAELVRVIAAHLGVRRSAVSILRGVQSRDKVLLIETRAP